MKHMKRFVALLAALALVLAMAVPAFADEGTGAATPETGTITINNTVDGTKYEVYRIFDLESYDKDAGKYSYKLNANWKNAGFASFAGAAEYFTINANDYVEWKTDKQNDGAGFAQLAKKFLADHTDLEKDGGATATGDTAKVVNLQLGYYLINTSLGSLCALNTTDPDATLDEKNGVPDVDKKIVENGTQTSENNAKIGDKVNYQTTITAKRGNTNYVLHDKMSEGLTYNADAAVYEKDGTTALDTAYYTIAPADDGCAFHVNFTEKFVNYVNATCTSASDNVTVVVKYSATLNEKAKVATTPTDGTNVNTNKAKLQYNNGSYSEEKTTTTRTYEFDLIKYNSAGQLLDGAEFELHDGDTALKFVYDETTKTYTVSNATGASKTIAAHGGKVTIKGLKNTTYTLKETKAPKGYNQIKNGVPVDLTQGSIKTTHTSGTTYNNTTDGGYGVLNNAGTTLPGTGGIGTTIFYLIGGGLMVAAAVLLIAKKRMENK